MERTLQWHRWADLKVTLSSVSESGLQKPPHSTYSTAAGANPAAEPQAAPKDASAVRAWRVGLPGADPEDETPSIYSTA